MLYNIFSVKKNKIISSGVWNQKRSYWTSRFFEITVESRKVKWNKCKIGVVGSNRDKNSGIELIPDDKWEKQGYDSCQHRER